MEFVEDKYRLGSLLLHEIDVRHPHVSSDTSAFLDVFSGREICMEISSKDMLLLSCFRLKMGKNPSFCLSDAA
jgi:hypothetical protein